MLLFLQNCFAGPVRPSSVLHTPTHASLEMSSSNALHRCLCQQHCQGCCGYCRTVDIYWMGLLSRRQTWSRGWRIVRTTLKCRECTYLYCRPQATSGIGAGQLLRLLTASLWYGQVKSFSQPSKAACLHLILNCRHAALRVESSVDGVHFLMVCRFDNRCEEDTYSLDMVRMHGAPHS